MMQPPHSPNSPNYSRADVNAVMLEFEPRIDLAVNAQVHKTAAYLEREVPDLLLELVPAYCTLLIYFDFTRVDYQDFVDRLKQLISQMPEHMPAETSAQREHLIEVCYAPEFGLDIAALAERLNLSSEAIAEQHSAVSYHVYALGFAPGFAYMGDVPAALRVPRLDSPRQKVPALSVAIAEQQTAIYPLTSPGGWHIIGRCKALPKLTAGDKVRFRVISAEQLQGGDK